ncbi:DUF4082 domain-containing protein [Yinghuangia seranimata]|uniref:DUF4082 domain-containing protein n=1 Tax=Yinghuangia seranimata TaxID=408067 RepID=UPI00248BF725|nr:DUF4082 domain-containing protein [Yinghuangia seranimata]MDI2130223.1 DUF4082 domain-containing protein [Yinghuangia seranimata]
MSRLIHPISAFRATRSRRKKATAISTATTALAAVAALIFTLFSPLSAQAAPCSPCSLFGTTNPGVGPDSETISVELGVRFTPKSNGRILGVKFWKDAANTGVHKGYLWNTTTGTSTQVTFSGETASGWQTALFPTPVNVTAGTQYIASYLAPNGRYTATNGFFNNAWDSEQLTAPATGADGNGVYHAGAGGIMPTDTWNGSNYWVDALFEPGADTVAPTVTATSPTNNATAVPINSALSATFSESVQANTIAWDVRKPDNSQVAGTATWDPATLTATFTPAANLALSTVHTVNLTGAKDAANNTMAPVTWSFTTAATPPSTSTFSIFTGNETVPTPNDDNSPNELGVRFKPTSNGFIKAIKFYKSSANTGPFTVSLWNTAGTRLGGVDNVTNLSGSGWKSVTLASPIAVTANTTYIASYHTMSGNYAYSNGFFSGQSAGNAKIAAPASTGAAPNGVYKYSSNTAFPSDTFEDSNYWVDVLYDTDGSDTTPPTVTGQQPGVNETGVPIALQPAVTFSEAVKPASISFTLKQGATTVPSTLQFDDPNQPTQVVLKPNAPLAYSTQYTLTLGGYQDLAGNNGSGTTWNFTTGAAPPPAPCSSPNTGPVLVITANANPYACYYSEILRAEGLNSFTTLDIGAVNATELNKYTTVILGDLDPNAALVTALTNWVNAGGNLIAMRPRATLSALTGLSAASGVISDQYVKVQDATGPGAGIYADRPIQFHGTADQWTAAADTTVIAELYRRTGAAEPADLGKPAVTKRASGSGTVTSFTFDLAKSVVLTRQGNPAQANKENDTLTDNLRSTDMFYRDWVDLNRVEVPQADEQQRLLANVIETVNREKAPLPRFWYFQGKAGSATPDINPVVLVSTGDHHNTAQTGITYRVSKYNANSDPACANVLTQAQWVKDWRCMRGTFYIWDSNGDATPSAVNSWKTQGYEVARHVSQNDNCIGVNPNSSQSVITSTLTGAFDSSLTDFRDAYGYSPTTSRTHCMTWPDFSTNATVEAAQGIRMDTNYYYLPDTWTNSYGSPMMKNAPGYYTGSGMPMRFTDVNGTMIDVYQATTQLHDEFCQTYPQQFNTMVDRAQGTTGFYAAITLNNHLDNRSANSTGTCDPVDQTAIQDAVIAAAKAKNVPVITAKQLLEWTDGRNQSSITGLARNGNTVTFTVNANAAAANLMTMLPTAGAGGTTLTGLTKSGLNVAFTKKTIKGIEYAVFNGVSGAYTATYAAPGGGGMTLSSLTANAAPAAAPAGPGAAPTVSTLTATPAADGSATFTWTTDTASTTEVALGEKPDALAPAKVVGENAGEHKVTVPGLKPDTTYYYRVTSVDSAGRRTVSPDPAQKPAQFKTPKADKKAPKITDQGAAPWPDGTAVLTWKTDEPSSSKVVVGKGAKDMRVASDDSTPVTDHKVVVTGLTPGQSYLFQMVSKDAAGNETVWSGKKADTARFDMPKDGVTEHTGPTFASGERTGGTVVNDTDGTLTLGAQAQKDWADGTGAGPWGHVSISPGGKTVVADGALTVDGSAAGTGLAPTSNRKLDFQAVFDGPAIQDAGWGDPHAGPAAVFEWRDGALHAVTLGAGAKDRQDKKVDGDFGGAPHRYTIERDGKTVRFSVDGQQVADIKAQLPPMVASARDNLTDRIPLRVKQLQDGDKATQGTYTSQILDAAKKVHWLQANWQADLPKGTSLKVSVRTGTTSTPDATWTQWRELPGPGAAVGGASRYLQYKVELTGNGAAAPTLYGITFTNDAKPAVEPPGAPQTGEMPPVKRP